MDSELYYRESKALCVCAPVTHFKEVDANQYYPTVMDLRGNVYLEGYWKFPDYFANCENLIRDELTPRRSCEADSAIAGRIKDVNSVSSHVRRGDYLLVPNIGVLPMAYYARAIAWMIERVERPHFFVFSDEPDWAKANVLIDAPVDYIAHDGVDSAFKDFYLMAKCRHHIIANSSFSWWAAWLSNSKSPLVVAPMHWFAGLPPANHPRLPANWKAL
jgi:hypothetical protein